MHTDDHKERGRLQQTTLRRTTHQAHTQRTKTHKKGRTTTASWRMWLLFLPRCLSPLSLPRLAHSGSRDPRTPCLRRLASVGQSTLAWPRAWRAWVCWRDSREVPILLPSFSSFLLSLFSPPPRDPSLLPCCLLHASGSGLSAFRSAQNNRASRRIRGNEAGEQVQDLQVDKKRRGNRNKRLANPASNSTTILPASSFSLLCLSWLQLLRASVALGADLGRLFGFL